MIDDDDDTLDADESHDALTFEAWAARSLREHRHATTSLYTILDAYSEATDEPAPLPAEALEALAYLFPVTCDDVTGGYTIHATFRH
jgi:hypothetical protein